jgi:RNA polymerase sigma-70 factor (ECF subfamily)
MDSSNKIILSCSICLNDKKVFDDIFNDLYGPLVFFANSFLKDNTAFSEDIVQDVFTNLLLKKTIFKNNLSLKAYLYHSVKNCCFNHLKHKKVTKTYAINKKAITSEIKFSFYDRIIEEEVKYQLIKALNVLPKRCKKVFELSLNGFKNSEIATEMNISIETVKSHKKNGKIILSNILKSSTYFFIILIIF